MVMEILDKIFMLVFFMATIITVRHGYYFLQAILNTDKKNTVKYVLTNKNLIILLVSISYLLTTIFTGIKL